MVKNKSNSKCLVDQIKITTDSRIDYEKTQPGGINRVLCYAYLDGNLLGIFRTPDQADDILHSLRVLRAFLKKNEKLNLDTQNAVNSALIIKLDYESKFGRIKPKFSHYGHKELGMHIRDIHLDGNNIVAGLHENVIDDVCVALNKVQAQLQINHTLTKIFTG